MYLRSTRGKKGWYENKIVAAINCDWVAGRRLYRSKVNKIILAGKINVKLSSSALSSSSDWKSLETKDIYQLGLERGMSEGERAEITPLIGWRKLTDPGD